MYNEYYAKKEIKMTKIKTFKLKQTFSGTKDLYGFLLKNIAFIEREMNIKIQKTLKYKSSCIVGKEERSALAGAFDVNIIVFFIQKMSTKYLETLSWLHRICNDDTLFIAVAADF